MSDYQEPVIGVQFTFLRSYMPAPLRCIICGVMFDVGDRVGMVVTNQRVEDEDAPNAFGIAGPFVLEMNLAHNRCLEDNREDSK